MKRFNWNGPLSLALVSLINIGSSFLIQLIMLAQMGVSNETDIFILVSTVPILISSVVSGLLNNVLLPYFSTKDKGELDDIIWKVLTIVGITIIITGVFVLIFLHVFFSFYLQKFKLSNIEWVSAILFFQIVAMALSAIYSVVWSYANAVGDHFRSEIIPMLISIASIPLVYYLLPKFGVIIIAITLAIRYFLSTIIQIKLSIKTPVSISLDSNVSRMIWSKVKPILFASIYYKSDILLERLLMVNAPAGSLSVLNLVQQIITAITQVITKSYCTPVIRKIGIIYNLNKKEYSLEYNRSLLMLSILILVIILIIYVFPNIFFYLLYWSENLKLVSDSIWIFSMLLSGMLFSNCLATLVNSSFYIAGDTSTPSKISAIIFTLFLPVKAVAYLMFGVEVMIAATSIYCLITLAALFFSQKKIKLQDKC